MILVRACIQISHHSPQDSFCLSGCSQRAQLGWKSSCLGEASGRNFSDQQKDLHATNLEWPGGLVTGVRDRPGCHSYMPNLAAGKQIFLLDSARRGLLCPFASEGLGFSYRHPVDGVHSSVGATLLE